MLFSKRVATDLQIGVNVIYPVAERTYYSYYILYVLV